MLGFSSYILYISKCFTVSFKNVLLYLFFHWKVNLHFWNIEMKPVKMYLSTQIHWVFDFQPISIQNIAISMCSKVLARWSSVNVVECCSDTIASFPIYVIDEWSLALRTHPNRRSAVYCSICDLILAITFYRRANNVIIYIKFCLCVNGEIDVFMMTRSYTYVKAMI